MLKLPMHRGSILTCTFHYIKGHIQSGTFFLMYQITFSTSKQSMIHQVLITVSCYSILKIFQNICPHMFINHCNIFAYEVYYRYIRSIF